MSLNVFVPLTDQHLDDVFPSGKTVDEDVGRFELMSSSVLLDLSGAKRIEISYYRVFGHPMNL